MELATLYKKVRLKALQQITLTLDTKLVLLGNIKKL